jgi:glutamyl-Q tRNA(Asp) synthetase
VPGAADTILRTLDAFGLHRDGAVLYQSTRAEAYRAALETLRARGAIYPCACSRREIADSALSGIEGPVYPGTCRGGLPEGRVPRALRVRTADARIEFIDAIQGTVAQVLEREVGDFVVWRADGMFAYQLAVVVDDAEQGITDIVRGADLLHSTPRQIHLQRLLGLPTPRYAHLPVAVNARGEKLSKQTRARAVDARRPAHEILRVLTFLDQPRPTGEPDAANLLQWAVAHWNPRRVSALGAARAAGEAA